MTKLPGIRKPELKALPQIRERLTFLYVEHCLINRHEGAVTIVDARGTVHVPAASLSSLMLGPGTNISHRAMELLGDVGACVCWVGEKGVRYYAHGRTLSHSAKLLIRQAELTSNVRSRVTVARRMYQLRFPNENVSDFTMQQLRGREGARVRQVYRRMAQETGVQWHGREYDPQDFNAGTPVNRALSAAHTCLYGLMHSIIVALGCSPGLGFVHAGHERSFVYDIADLYKANTSIPVAFDVAAEVQQNDIGACVRQKMRDVFVTQNLPEQAVKDIRLLLLDDAEISDEPDLKVLYLWDDRQGQVANAISYGRELDSYNEEVLGNGYGTVLED